MSFEGCAPSAATTAATWQTCIRGSSLTPTGARTPRSGGARLPSWKLTVATGSIFPSRLGTSPLISARLLGRAGPDAAVLSGFDFPIGLPACYAGKVGLTEFRAALTGFGRGRWRDFYAPASSPSAISVTRPFYPESPGGARREHLVEALGVPTFHELKRRCDQCSGAESDFLACWGQTGGEGGDHWVERPAQAGHGKRPTTFDLALRWPLGRTAGMCRRSCRGNLPGRGVSTSGSRNSQEWTVEAPSVGPRR